MRKPLGASPRHTLVAGWAGTMVLYRHLRSPYRTYGRRLPVSYVTSIGLDVHARSVSACAFDPFTGEVSEAAFGTDAAEIAKTINARLV